MNALAFRPVPHGSHSQVVPAPGDGATCQAVAAIAAPADARPVPAPSGGLRRWWISRRAARAQRRALSDIPEHLRLDIGLDGSLPLARFENGGRTFLVGTRPDPTLSGWHW